MADRVAPGSDPLPIDPIFAPKIKAISDFFRDFGL